MTEIKIVIACYIAIIMILALAAVTAIVIT